jgi:hypothetical protein
MEVVDFMREVVNARGPFTTPRSLPVKPLDQSPNRGSLLFSGASVDGAGLGATLVLE